MRTIRLLAWLTFYYLGLIGILAIAWLIWPRIMDFLPIGGVEALISTPNTNVLGAVPTAGSGVRNFGESLMWLAIAIIGALVAALPVSWTYMNIRHRDEYDQSLVQTIVLLPLVVTSIVIVVHNSLALAFSLAGIAAGVQFRNALKSPGDVLFILLSIGIGLAAGIGAVELAIVMSIAFNYVFLGLWVTDYGHRRGGERFMRKSVSDRDEDERREAEEREEEEREERKRRRKRGQDEK